jgi:hypothetical protein
MVAGKMILRAAGAIAAAAVLTGAVAAGVAHGQNGSDRPPGVVLVGVPGLAWTDVTPEDMPTLHSLAGTDAAASLTVRTIRSRTCTVDGWLTLGAGKRAIDLEDTTGNGEPDRFCREAPEPVRAGDGMAVPGWDELTERQADQGYGTELGLLGVRLAEAGVCATAAGPGAAMALADESGRVASYRPDVSDLTSETISACPVTVVDLGGLPVRPAPDGDAVGADDADGVANDDLRERVLAQRRAAAAEIDRQITALAAIVPDDVALLVAGVADSAAATSIPAADEPLLIAPSGLRVAIAAGPMPSGDAYGPNWLSSRSTRWTGLVQLTDIAATLADFAGLDDPSAGTVGGPWRLDGAHPRSAAGTVDELVSAHRATMVFRTQSGPFFQFLGLGQLIFFGGALLWLRARPSDRTPVLRIIQHVALAAASFPVASFLANLGTWWRFEHPAVALWATVAAITLVVTVVATAGPWRHRIYGPPGVIAGITAIVLAGDVSTGGALQQTSLLGLSPVVGGRFFGFSNISFALFAVAVIVAAAALAQWLRDLGWTTRAVTTVTATAGLLAIAATGSTAAGANVGGTLSLVPGVALLVLAVAGARITVTRLAAAGVLALAVIALVSWLDWLRPTGSRTHFGQFFADVLDGETLRVIVRKAKASLGTLQRAPHYGTLVPLAYAVIGWLSRGSGIAGMRSAYTRWPLLRYAIWAGLLTGAVAFAVNDSGIIIPALLLTLGVPLAVSAVAHAQVAEAEPPGSPALVQHPVTAGPDGAVR